MGLKVILIRIFTVACVVHGVFWSVFAALGAAAVASDGLVDAAVAAAHESPSRPEVTNDQVSAEHSRKPTGTTADYLAGKLSAEEARAVEEEIIARDRLVPRGFRFLDGTSLDALRETQRAAEAKKEQEQADRLADARNAARTAPGNLVLTILAGALAGLAVLGAHILAFKTGLWVVTGRWRLSEALSAASSRV